MKFPYMTKYNGVYYEAGEEVPCDEVKQPIEQPKVEAKEEEKKVEAKQPSKVLKKKTTKD